MILKNPLPDGWSPVPESFSFRGRPYNVGGNLFYKNVGDDMILVILSPNNVMVSATAGIAEDDVLRLTVELCRMEVGDKLTLM